MYSIGRHPGSVARTTALRLSSEIQKNIRRTYNAPYLVILQAHRRCQGGPLREASEEDAAGSHELHFLLDEIGNRLFGALQTVLIDDGSDALLPSETFARQV